MWSGYRQIISESGKKIVVMGLGIMVAVVLYVIYFNFYVSNKILIEPITEDDFEKYSYCIRDSDCSGVRVPRSDSCGCEVYANKVNLKDYNRELDQMCKGYKGSICGVSICAETQPKCDKGSCVGVRANFNLVRWVLGLVTG